MAPVTSGFHYTPTQEEILNKILIKIKNREPLPRTLVERHIYNDHSPPWDIFSENDPWLPDGGEFSKKHVLHVYTKVSYVGKEKTTGGGRGFKNVKRRSGHGSWSGQNSYNLYNEVNEVIGYLRKFSYEPDKNWLDLDTMRKEYGGWNMHEYSLKGINGTSDYVFCKVMVNLNYKDGAVAGLLNEGVRVIEQEDMMVNNLQNNAVTRVVPFLPPPADLSNQGLITRIPVANPPLPATVHDPYSNYSTEHQDDLNNTTTTSTYMYEGTNGGHASAQQHY